MFPWQGGGWINSPHSRTTGLNNFDQFPSPAEILNLGCTEEAMKYTNTFGPFQPGCIKSLWVGSGILYQSSPSGTKVQPRLISTALTSLCLNFLT